MSKHSKWAKIKRQKGVSDVKKGNVFTKLGNAIAIAAKGGDDPTTNFKLRLAIDKARGVNMPNDTIERAIARGAGKIEGQIIEEVLYEVFGPAGIAVMIETMTDNKNRTVNDLKRILSDCGGRLGGPGSVARLFSRKGMLTIPKSANTPTLELAVIDAGADNMTENDEIIITTAPQHLQTVQQACCDNGITPTDATLEWIAKEHIAVPNDKRESAQNFFEALDALDDVQEWYSNVAMENL